MKRKFAVTIYVENDAETLAIGLQNARQTIKSLGLVVQDCKPVKSLRTMNQNSALHLFFQQLADELNEKGFDMRALIRQDVEIQWTGYSIKENLWKPLQKALFGKKSTTQLEKTEEIDRVYDNLNRILIERTKGEVQIPPFPCLDELISKEES